LHIRILILTILNTIVISLNTLTPEKLKNPCQHRVVFFKTVRSMKPNFNYDIFLFLLIQEGLVLPEIIWMMYGILISIIMSWLLWFLTDLDFMISYSFIKGTYSSLVTKVYFILLLIRLEFSLTLFWIYSWDWSSIMVRYVESPFLCLWSCKMTLGSLFYYWVFLQFLYKILSQRLVLMGIDYLRKVFLIPLNG